MEKQFTGHCSFNFSSLSSDSFVNISAYLKVERLLNKGGKFLHSQFSLQFRMLLVARNMRQIVEENTRTHNL